MADRSAPLWLNPAETRALAEELRALDAPLRKCPASPDVASKLRSKARFAAVLEALALPSTRHVAELLGVDESAVRRWLDLRNPTTYPPEWVFDRLGRDALVAYAKLLLERVREIDESAHTTEATG